MSQEIPRYEDMYKSDYFSPDDFQPGECLPVKILAVEGLELENKAKRVPKKWRAVFTVEGQTKKVAVNKTSYKRLRPVVGVEFEHCVGKWISISGAEVNGKPAVLCTPIAAPAEKSTNPPEKVAWATVLSACGNDKDQATVLWRKLKQEHGGNYEAIIAACAVPN